MPDLPLQKVKKIVHYYTLTGVPHRNFRISTSGYNTSFQALLNKISILARDKSNFRYQLFGEKQLFINEQRFDLRSGKHVVKGKLLSARKDFFPELLNMSTDNLRDIDAIDVEGVVETTHFVFQETNKNLSNCITLSLEYNTFGARVNDLRHYLEMIANRFEIFQSISFQPVTNSEIITLQNRIGKISRVFLRVHKDNLPALSQTDNGIFKSLQLIEDEYEQEYIEVTLKYDIRKMRKLPNSSEAKASNKIVNRILRYLGENKDHYENFEAVNVIAEDSEKNDKLNAFDLLVGKVKDEFVVERRYPSKTLVSLDMFEQMENSWIRRRIKIE